MFIPETIDELDALARVRIFGDDVSGENVRDQVVALQRFQFEGERITDGDGGRWSTLVHDQQTDAGVQDVLRRKEFDRRRTAGSVPIEFKLNRADSVDETASLTLLRCNQR